MEWMSIMPPSPLPIVIMLECRCVVAVPVDLRSAMLPGPSVVPPLAWKGRKRRGGRGNSRKCQSMTRGTNVRAYPMHCRGAKDAMEEGLRCRCRSARKSA